MSTVQLAPQRADDVKEAAIIDGARKTFLARGFDAASMDQIALIAGVSKRTVYNRFRSKEELFAAAIMDTCTRILPVDIEAIEASLPPRQFVREMARQFLKAILAPEAVALRRIAAFESTRTPALGRSYLEYGPRLMVRTCAPLLERLTQRGVLKTPPGDRAIWQLGSLITEPLYTFVLMGETPADLDAAIETQLDSGLDAFFRLYGA